MHWTCDRPVDILPYLSCYLLVGYGETNITQGGSVECRHTACYHY
jgi:hypothetical protein